MKKQMPNWLFGAILAVSIVGVLWLLGRTTTPPPPPAAVLPSGVADTTVTEFSGPTADGKTFRLADTKGKVVLLNFWATWCGPCRQEIPDLIKVQEKYRSRGFTVVGASADDELSTAKAFAKEQGMNYPVLIAEPQTRQELGIEALPTSVLLDREGHIVWMQAGISPDRSVEDVLSEQIEKVL